MKATNIVWHNGQITKKDRERLLKHKNKVLWFTGLSGSGKSTIAHALEKRMHDLNILTYVFDGDNVRHGLNKDLGFSKEDRDENIRRIGEVSKLFYDAGVFILVCFISPYRSQRDEVRRLVGDDFMEIFVDCSVEECERRDVKGLYKKAKAGEIKGFTGISAPYEVPENPELAIDTVKLSVDESVDEILRYLNMR